MEKISRLLSQLIILPIRLYQWLISPMLAPSCRFYPSCSEYTLSAIQTFGPMRGLLKSFRRLLRCHPWSKGGHDPVLPNKENSNG